MGIVRSAWTTPINVMAGFVPADRAGAGSVALPVGSMLVKNDNHFAYTT